MIDFDSFFEMVLAVVGILITAAAVMLILCTPLIVTGCIIYRWIHG